MHARVRGGGRESVSNRHFHVVVQQPIGFCIMKKRANRRAWFIFSRLIRHFLPCKMQHPFFSSFTAVMSKRKADESGALGNQ